MQIKKGDIVEIPIESLAFGGRGVGHYQGLTVFVDDTLPGDRVKASFTKIKKQYSEASLVEVVQESPDRINPRCEYFDRCGGCKLQFTPYEKQLEMKKQQVIDTFERIGNLPSPPVEDVIGCEAQFYYRNKMEFSFGYDAEMNFALGMHVPGRRYDILDLHNCYLQSEKSVEIVNTTREFAEKTGWPCFKYSVGEGFLKALYVREGKYSGEVMVNLVTSDDKPEDVQAGMEEFNKIMVELGVTSVYWTQTVSRRGVPRRLVESLLSGRKTIQEKIILKNGDELTFEILPQAFFQVNTHQVQLLYGEVLEMVLQDKHDCVFDLFCGTGTIGLFLAKHVKKVYGVDLNAQAIESAKENAVANGISNVEFLVGDATKVVHELPEKPSIIVVDPPRAGLDARLIQKIVEFGSQNIVYVSCNPATLARDCNIFREQGFKTIKIRPVDMFPQTAHIENVCLLSRETI